MFISPEDTERQITEDEEQAVSQLCSAQHNHCSDKQQLQGQQWGRV